MISHHHRTIFIHIPKCAGTSLETAFLEDIGLTYRTRAPFIMYRNHLPELGPQLLSHMIATDYVNRGYIPQRMFDAYFSFAVVRNPWTRAVSIYRALNINTPFRTFILDWLPQQLAGRDWYSRYFFVRPQVDFVTDGHRVLIKQIVRFERLADEFAGIAAICNLSSPLQQKNKSNDRLCRPRNPLAQISRSLFNRGRDIHDHWAHYYDHASANEVGRLYEKDIDMFGYSLPRELGG